ncbi:MAG: DNA-3-methyladenine glycosylase [Candidatus Moranbacteria bacterium]|nr:DNA-3-methyladenine glycosylase [Candidatus Moranbacteria bacterium]
MILRKKFYQKNTLKVARNLIGCFLVRKIGKKIIRGVITETEAYIGEKDLACHASRGKTPRTEIMYGEAGHAYIYLIYGMYHCLNIVTEKKNFPAAVLIRGIKPLGTFRAKDSTKRSNLDSIVLDGPGKVCRFFKIDKKLNGCDITKGKKLWIEKGIKFKEKDIKKSKRIGIDYAGHSRHYLWRLYLPLA